MLGVMLKDPNVEVRFLQGASLGTLGVMANAGREVCSDHIRSFTSQAQYCCGFSIEFSPSILLRCGFDPYPALQICAGGSMVERGI